jgi:hydroxymethylglutaryl-CoA lyase
VNVKGSGRTVRLREVGMRDGLQSIATVMPTEDKLAWLSAEVAAGVREVEVCSFVPPRLLPQFADAAAVVRGAMAMPGLTVAVLVPNAHGARTALDLGVHKINYVISASESHNKANVRRSRAESLAGFREVAALARGTSTTIAGGVSTAFGCTIEGAIAEADVLYIVNGYIEAGAREIILADTVGYADPTHIRSLIERVRAEVGDLPIALHLHDTRGLGLANVVAGLEAGVRDFDASLGGMGGCPYAPGASGNIVTEDLAFMLEAGGWETGIDVARLVGVRDVVQRSLPGVELLGAVARAGLPRGFARHGA